MSKLKWEDGSDCLPGDTVSGPGGRWRVDAIYEKSVSFDLIKEPDDGRQYRINSSPTDTAKYSLESRGDRVIPRWMDGTEVMPGEKGKHHETGVDYRIYSVHADGTVRATMLVMATIVETEDLVKYTPHLPGPMKWKGGEDVRPGDIMTTNGVDRYSVHYDKDEERFIFTHVDAVMTTHDPSPYTLVVRAPVRCPVANKDC